MDAKHVSRRLYDWLSENERLLIMQNVFVNDSPWESDMVSVTPAFYLTEYEIKVSREDYKRDFEKALSNKVRQKHLPAWPKKHDLLASPDPIDKRKYYKGKIKNPLIVKPKHFYFVAPAGLLSYKEIPDHCGLIEIGSGVGISKYAPKLESATKLDTKMIFGFAVKATKRLGSK